MQKNKELSLKINEFGFFLVVYTDEIFIYCIACSRHSEGGAWAKNKVSEKKKRRIRESRERIQSPLSPLLLLLIFLLTLLPGYLNPWKRLFG